MPPHGVAEQRGRLDFRALGCPDARPVDDERERKPRERRRHRHARRRLRVLHLEPLRRDRSCAPARPVLPRHTLLVADAPAAQRRNAGATCRDGCRSVQWRVRAARAPGERACGLPPRGAPPPVCRPGHAGGHRDRELRRGSRVLLGGDAARRRLRRSVRGQGRPCCEAGRAQRGGPRCAPDVQVQAPLLRPRHPHRLQRSAPLRRSAGHVRDRRATARALEDMHRGDTGDRRARGDPALPVRTAGRALDAGGATGGVEGADAGRVRRP